MPETYNLTDSESVTVVTHAPDLLEVEGHWGPNGSPPPKHFHPGQDERFEIKSGTLTARVGGAERTLGPGDVLEIRRGAVHQLWNAGDEPVVASWQTTPALRTASWFKAISELKPAAKRPSPLAFGVYLTEYSDVFRLAGPQFVLKPALAALGAVGRLRGYRPRPLTE